MKSVRNGLLSATIALGLFTVATGNIQAQGSIPFPINIPQPFTIQMTGVVQGPDTTNGLVVSTSATTIRIATKDILNLIANCYGTNFPSGSKLALYGTDVYLVDKTISPLENLTYDNVLGILYDSGGYMVYQGQTDYATCQLSYTDSFMAELEFYDWDGNGIDFYGLMQEKISLTAVDSLSNQKGSASFALTGASWEAMIGGVDDAVVSGTLKAKGKTTGPASSLCPL